MPPPRKPESFLWRFVTTAIPTAILCCGLMLGAAKLWADNIFTTPAEARAIAHEESELTMKAHSGSDRDHPDALTATDRLDIRYVTRLEFNLILKSLERIEGKLP